MSLVSVPEEAPITSTKGQEVTSVSGANVAALSSIPPSAPGATTAWHCEWCGIPYRPGLRRRKGPSGPHTLCLGCGVRHGRGFGRPPPTDSWQCAWCTTSWEKLVVKRRLRGPDGPDTLCRPCGCHYIKHGIPPTALSDDWRCSGCGCGTEGTVKRNTASNGVVPVRFSGPQGDQTLCVSCGQKYIWNLPSVRANHLAGTKASAPCETADDEEQADNEDDADNKYDPRGEREISIHGKFTSANKKRRYDPPASRDVLSLQHGCAAASAVPIHVLLMSSATAATTTMTTTTPIDEFCITASHEPQH